MKRLAAFILLFAMTITSPAAAWEVEGYPGSLWANASYDDDKISGSGGMGFIQQGIWWFTIPTGAQFVTYAEYRDRFRTENNLYYDSGGPVLGAELRWSHITLGVDYYWERLPILRQSSAREQYYLTAFYGWNMDRDMTWAEALPGSVWFNASYDNDNISGSGVMGFVNQGIQWFTINPGIAFVTYAEYRHRSRSQNQTYYNSGGPAVGAEFRKSYFTLGADYYWERLPVLGQTSNRLQLYFTMYYWWDLKEKS